MSDMCLEVSHFTNKSSVQFELVGQISELKLWRKSQTRGTNMTLACVILLTQKASSCAWTIWSQNHIECRLDVTGSLQKSRGADFRGCYRLLIAVGKMLSSYKFIIYGNVLQFHSSQVTNFQFEVDWTSHTLTPFRNEILKKSEFFGFL